MASNGKICNKLSEDIRRQLHLGIRIFQSRIKSARGLRCSTGRNFATTHRKAQIEKCRRVIAKINTGDIAIVLDRALESVIEIRRTRLIAGGRKMKELESVIRRLARAMGCTRSHIRTMML